MQDLTAFFLTTEISQWQRSLNMLHPAVIESAKVVLVSFTWIGGLCWFMIRKDKSRDHLPV